MKKKINFIILIFITCLVLYFSLKDNFNETINTILNMSFIFILISFLLVIIHWLFRSYTMYSFTKQINKNFKFKSAFQLLLRTQFFNAITPFSSGGQPYQVLYLKQSGLSYSSATSVVLECSIVYQIALVFLGTISIIINNIFHVFTKVLLLQKLVILGFVINSLVIVMMFILAFGKRINKFLVNGTINLLYKLHIIKDKDTKKEKWNNSINEFHESAKLLLSNKKIFIANISYSFLALCCIYLVPLFVIYATGNYSAITPGVSIITSAYIMIIGAFVPIPGATGGLEYGFIQFFGNFIGGGILSAVMLIWRFITYYFGIIVGSIALNIKKVK